MARLTKEFLIARRIDAENFRDGKETEVEGGSYSHVDELEMLDTIDALEAENAAERKQRQGNFEAWQAACGTINNLMADNKALRGHLRPLLDECQPQYVTEFCIWACLFCDGESGNKEAIKHDDDCPYAAALAASQEPK